uniref:RanBP2-type domain-containing protein n=1 Tax=Strongyloides papillosus TaxID=174720 RepID=A0A0N5CF09_STREA
MDNEGTIEDFKSGDWICLECGTKNTRKSATCDRCSLKITTNSVIQKSGSFFAGKTISDTLIIRGLPICPAVTKEKIIKAFEEFNTNIIEIFFEQNGNFCFIKLENKKVAENLINLIRKRGLFIDNYGMTVNYSNIPMNVIHKLDYPKRVRYVISYKSRNMKKIAMNSNANRKIVNSIEKEENLSVGSPISTPFGDYFVCEFPDIKTFVGPNIDGYYSDPKTGFCYDPERTLFFDPSEFVWKFWSLKYQTYIVYSGGDRVLKSSTYEETRSHPDFDKSRLSSKVENLNIGENSDRDSLAFHQNNASSHPEIHNNCDNKMESNVSSGRSLESNLPRYSRKTLLKDTNNTRRLSQNITVEEHSSNYNNHHPQNCKSRSPSPMDIPSDDDISKEHTKANNLTEDIEKSIDEGKYDYLLPDFYEFLRTNLSVQTYDDLRQNKFYRDPFIINWNTSTCNICGIQFLNKRFLIRHILYDNVHKDNVNNIGNE